MEKIGIALIGLGCRGSFLIKRVFTKMKDVRVVAVSDSYADRMDAAVQLINQATGDTPVQEADYRRVLEREDVAAVFIFTDWTTHIKIAIEAMQAGKAVGMEVGCAYSIEECWDLVKTYERTKAPFMLLENCCFDKMELLATSLVRKGVLGKIVHASGAYGHDLREEIADGYLNRHYRKDNYIHRNCDNYPTHEFGPIAKILNINRGNRILSIVSFASKSEGLKEFIKTHRPNSGDGELTFNQGDVITTMIKYANGETVSLKLETTLPRRYDREFYLSGTKGSFSQTTNSVFLDGDDEWASLDKVKDTAANFQDYLPSVWKNITEEDKKSGHGGMDGITIRQFIKCLKVGEEMPIDVYDAATWLSIGCLSEQSIATGSVVYCPDFTNGQWVRRQPKDVIELD